MAIGGWGGWNWAVGSSMILKNAAGEELTVYCLLDRDSYGDDVLHARYKEAMTRDLHLHIWQYRELENYLVVAPAIARLIRKRAGMAVPLETVTAAIDEAAASLREELEDDIATRIQQEERGIAFKTAKAKARKRVEARLAKLPLHAVVSGKGMLSQLAKWAQSAYGVSFGAPALAREILASEIPAELASVLKSLQEGRRFQNAGESVA